MKVSGGGDLWIQEYFFDNVYWNNAGSFTPALTVIQAGFYGGNAVEGGSPTHVMIFDHFFLMMLTHPCKRGIEEYC